MTQTSIGFNGSISAAQWAAAGPLLLDGSDCLGAPGDLAITQVSGQRAVSVAAGRIAGDGVVTTLDAAEVVNLPTPTNGQWFLLVENRKWSTGATSLLLRNGATTSSTFGFMPPTAYPASVTSTPGADADVPVAWLWATSTSTAVYVFPIALPSPNIAPYRGDGAARTATLGPYFPQAGGSIWGTIWAQYVYPAWYVTTNGEWQQYIGAYDATANGTGKATAGWTVAGMQSSPLRYATEAGLRSTSNALGQYGRGGLAYAIDTDGLYYRRSDGRVPRLDADTIVQVVGSGSQTSGTALGTMGGSSTDYKSSDTAVFPVRSDGVIGPLPVSGWYEVVGNLAWQSTSNGDRYLSVTLNDSELTPPIADRTSGAGSSPTNVAGWIKANAGDYIKLKAWQNSGSTLTYNSRLQARLMLAQ